MSVQEIKAAISALPRTELADLASWIAALDTEAWEEQIARDVELGRFDEARKRVRAERLAGECRTDVPGAQRTGDS